MRYRRVDYVEEGRMVGTLPGVVREDEFISGYSAGFGGVDFLRESERPDIVFRLVERTVEELRYLGIKRVRILAKPFHYSGSEAYLHLALLRHGFAIEEANINFYFELTRYGNPNGYLHSLRHAPKRQLLRALAERSEWHELDDVGDWTRPYEILQESRARHGATLSLTLEYIRQLRSFFAERIRMYELSHDGIPVAASLVYSVTRRHAMVMYWGNSQRHDRAATESDFAAMNLVAYRTVETALALGFETVDLGPGSTSEWINYGNCRFKTSIGALPNFRYTMTKSL